MRHLIVLMIAEVRVAEDIVQSVSNHVFSKALQGACIGLLREFLAADNVPEFIETCKSFEKTIKAAEKKANEWGESFQQYLVASGLGKMCDDLFEG